MFKIFKKTSTDEIELALEQHNVEPIFRFIKKNKKIITNVKKTHTKETSLFRKINANIVFFPLKEFKQYVDFLIQCRIDSRFIVRKNFIAPNTLLHGCIEARHIRHAEYLLQTKLFSLEPQDFFIWDMLFSGYGRQTKRQTEEVVFETFHFIMKNGGDLNLILGESRILDIILHHSSFPFVNGLEPYLHLLTEEDIEIYKQKRLQHLF